MTGIDRSLIRRAAAVASLSVILVAPVGAQQPRATADSGPGFLTRYDFHLSAASLAINDERFSWDTHVGGELDVIDYVAGRASILVDYQAVLGDQFRPFDPNQGNYTLEASLSARVGQTEIAGAFHHMSKHLSDRPKRFAIAWNSVNVRVMRRVLLGGTALDLEADAGRVTQRSQVDYAWTGQIGVVARRPVTAHAGVFVRAEGQMVGVVSSVAQRERQTGGLVEAGVRLDGRAGAIELFAGYERRVDADPVDRQPQHWGLAGFRLVGR